MCGAVLRPAAPFDARALIARMTLDEKIALVHGARDPGELGMAGYWPGLPRLGIPPLRFADGPPGINANREATAMPAPVALAATFSEAAARLYGETIGREARALRADVVLAPHVNIVRDPLFRRNHTSLSEDPLLAASIGAAEIEGIQSQGVMAQVKHLAGYNGSDNVEIDQRTLREIYLPPFEAAVRAGAASVMCAYNRVNGEWACENADLQNGILRGAWGFRGFVTSDWGAVHSSGAIARGVDLEMPGRPLAFSRGGPYFSDELKAAVQSGAVPESVLDQAVSRILGEIERMRARRVAAQPPKIDVEAHARAVRAIAAEGAVLLKNEGGALPLTPADLASLAVIGPTAGQLAAGFMGERGYGFEKRLASPVEALRRSAPTAKIVYSPGVDLTGVPVAGIAQPPPLAADQDYRWSGTILVAEAGEYTFMVQPAVGQGADGGGTVAIDGPPVARTGGPGFGGTGMLPKKWSSLLPTTDGRDNGRGSVALAAGEHRIETTAHSTGDKPLEVRFAWITPEMRARAIREAAHAARQARTAVVFAWHGAGSFEMPEDQDELIATVAAANPRTVVVLNTGGPVAMPWKDAVRAILEMWYPGQEGGWATADLLLGRANPSGKLPVTFGRRLEDAPARDRSHPERLPRSGPPGSAGGAGGGDPVRYTEGMAVGYRWYDEKRIEPNFPFGHGLSYSRFEYSGLKVRRAGRGAAVTLTVRNAAARPGAEVVQVYLGAPTASTVALPPRTLAGFRRVWLGAHATRTVTIPVEERSISYWSVEEGGWALLAGPREVFAGSSSRDLRLSARLP